jgi:hypothetical protein
MTNNAEPPGDTDRSNDEAGDGTAPVKSPRDTGDHDSTTSNDEPHVIYDPLPTSRADITRQQKALRRAYHASTAPSWVKKIPWVIFPLYGIMRMHDPNYEEHFAHWQEQQRANYGEGEPQ